MFSHFLLLLSLFLLISNVSTTSFNYRFFDSPKKQNFQGNYSLRDGFILLNTDQNGAPLNDSVGRVLHAEPVHLWDSSTGKVADFTTRFSFMIEMLYPPYGADGMAFFIAPNGSQIPPNSYGGSFGIFYKNNKFNSTQNPIVAVEFDTFRNWFDPSGDHVGIDINSVVSEVTWNTTLKYDNRTRGNAWIGYNSTTKTLGVYLSFDQNPVFDGKYVLTHVVDLKNVLPEWVNVGLSAATGSTLEAHNIYTWEFNSTEFPAEPGTRGSQFPQESGTGNGGEKKNNIGMVIGLAVGGTTLAGGIGLVFYHLRKKRKGRHEEVNIFDASGEHNYVRGAGARRFTYKELDRATSHFAKDGKLGKGGFGEVYRGFVNDQLECGCQKSVKRVQAREEGVCIRSKDY
ncbi:hypothetical protein Sjap_022508 [Stephania japonica]|uniref:Legume lectin domain-containing protein n=1 Tax=Stephania japonica TaxID=461633 RepID=A0AAP0EP12_9MAGN